MADIDVEHEKEAAPPEETRTETPRKKSVFERAMERSFPSETETRRPVHDDEQHGGIVLEPVEHQPYIISYVCVLIPRFDTHFLSGDVVDNLHAWMHRLAVSFTWRLEWIDIQRQYMQWNLKVPVSLPPAKFIRLTRQHTSQLILTEFPRYRRENVSWDFWAPGNLINVGKRPHPIETINEFIRLTRQQQGIFSPHR